MIKQVPTHPLKHNHFYGEEKHIYRYNDKQTLKQINKIIAAKV